MDKIYKFNNKTLLDEWNFNLEKSTLTKLIKCKSLFYPGAGSDFSTLQFFMENSGVKDFYYVDYDYDNFDQISENLKLYLYNYDYQIINQINLYPKNFNEKNWDGFWHQDSGSYDRRNHFSFITKTTIKRDEQVWNLFYFGTEGIGTYEVLLKNKINQDILVTIDQSGIWTPFSQNSLLEDIAINKKMLPKMILSGEYMAWYKFVACSESFGKFGFGEENRKLYHHEA